MISHRLSQDCLRALLPKPRVPTAEWCAQNIRMPMDSKVSGNYSLALFPWAREIFTAFDDPTIEDITLQTAAQLGKTTLAFGCVLKTAAYDPHPMAWADADERSTRRVLTRLWSFMEKTSGLSHLCPARAQQASDCIATSTFLIHGAWTRASSTAADYGAKVVVLNEADKMLPTSTSREADFRFLMRERRKGYHEAKLLEMSTPTLKGDSYIEGRRLAGDNRQWYVPCPHCRHFQRLKTGNGRDPGGLRFSKLNGQLNAAWAERTAWYECEQCRGKIEEHHRYAMLHRGLWVPDGCRITAGKVTGHPARPGPHASFGPLPTLASLLPGVTFGKCAAEYVACLTAGADRSERLRNWINSWEGETYDAKPPNLSTNEVRERITLSIPARVCPSWSRFLTAAADVGRVQDQLLFHWGCACWARVEGPGDQWGRRGHLVDHGIAVGEDAFRVVLQQLQTVGYPHESGGRCVAARVGIDSGEGAVTSSVYRFCETVHAWPVKGGSHAMPGYFDLGFQRAGLPAALIAARRQQGLADLFLINTHKTQTWRQDQLSGVIPRESPDWFSLPEEFAADDGLLDQLASDFPVPVGGSVQWHRRGANEMGDVLRYLFALADFVGSRNGGKWRHLPLPLGQAVATAGTGRGTVPPPPRGFVTPSGQPYLASRR